MHYFIFIVIILISCGGGGRKTAPAPEPIVDPISAPKPFVTEPPTCLEIEEDTANLSCVEIEGDSTTVTECIAIH